MGTASRRLAALFIVGLLCFYSPLLGGVNRPVTYLGVPVLPLYLFACWVGLVVGAALASRREPP